MMTGMFSCRFCGPGFVSQVKHYSVIGIFHFVTTGLCHKIGGVISPSDGPVLYFSRIRLPFHKKRGIKEIECAL